MTEFISHLFTAEGLIALTTLTLLEIVLGSDNVIFIAILTGKLPAERQTRARTIGISLAVITRILLLLAITWIMQLTQPLFTLFDNGLSGRDLILLAGGMFLIGKSTFEIHEKLESIEHARSAKVAANFAAIILQVILIDIVFSLDSESSRCPRRRPPRRGPSWMSLPSRARPRARHARRDTPPRARLPGR